MAIDQTRGRAGVPGVNKSFQLFIFFFEEGRACRQWQRLITDINIFIIIIIII